MMHHTEGLDLTDGQRATLETADRALAALRAARVPSVRAADSAGLASWALRSYRQLWLRRVIDLAEGARSEWNAHRFVNVAVLLRSQLETMAAFYAVLDQSERLLAQGDLRSLHKRVLKAMYGIKQGRDTHPGLPEAVNVLTVLDQLDRVMPKVRRYYDSLCEIVHPNADGLQVFGELDHDAYALNLFDTTAAEPFCIKSVVAGIHMLGIAPMLLEMAEQEALPRIEQLERKHGPHPDGWPEI
jgi:hypothetical protein